MFDFVDASDQLCDLLLLVFLRRDAIVAEFGVRAHYFIFFGTFAATHLLIPHCE